MLKLLIAAMVLSVGDMPTIHIRVQGLDRHFMVYLPTAPVRGSTSKMPLLLVLGTTIIREVYSNLATGVLVEGITVTGGGHTWPGGWAYLPAGMVGITSRNLDANEAIWVFSGDFREPPLQIR